MSVPQPEDSLPPGPRLLMAGDEDLATALRRMALEQADVVIRGFEVSEDDVLLDHAVHQARKAGKRLRALLRLCRFELGAHRYRWANSVVRDQCRLLSGARTSAVLMRTLDELTVDSSAPVDAGGRLRDLLSRHHADSLAQLRLDSFGSDEAKRALTDVVAGIRTLPVPAEYRSGDITALERGIRRAYRNGKRTMRTARRLDTAHAFHEWRKKANYLRFQLEALSGVCAPPIAALAEALEELVEVLGSDHDLADLLEVVAVAPTAEVPGLPALIEERSRPLRGQALRLGSQVFDTTNDGFVRFFAEQAPAPAR